jgi:pimeloyl-ACP methyl ester carboxylesterase
VAAPPPPASNVILAQGAGADETHWAKVIPLLEKAGLHVTAVGTSSTALEAAVAEMRRVLGLQDGPTVLVGHGWDGAVVSEAGADPKVSALVYLDAVAPEAGEDFAALSTRFPAQTFTAASFIDDKIDVVAWRGKPTFYAVSKQSQALSPELQRFYAARMKAKTIVLDSVAMFPREVAGLILEAAGMRPPACGAEDDDGKAACAAPALPRSLMEGCRCTKGSLENLTSP